MIINPSQTTVIHYLEKERNMLRKKKKFKPKYTVEALYVIFLFVFRKKFKKKNHKNLLTLDVIYLTNSQRLL